jgi:ATP-dependent helicase IRC3
MPREILTAATFTDAVHGADSFAAKMFPHTFIHRYQRWRTLPPTQGQVDFINKMRGKAEPLKLENLDKGKAADMITKLKHGARGQFARIEAGQRRQDKQVRLAEAKRLREQVKVGPVAS